MCGGMAAQGLKPIFAVYSTFLQRAYDEILEDICLNERPVTLAIDRAGIVGSDGETHQGLFDLAFLSHMPGMVVMAPRNGAELRAMLRFAVTYDGPAAVRYPRGSKDLEALPEKVSEIRLGRAEVLAKGKGTAILFLGPLGEEAMGVKAILQKNGKGASVVNARFASPFDRELIRTLSADHDLIVTMEEGVRTGGFGERVAAFAEEEQLPVRVMICSMPDAFQAHATQQEIRNACGLNAEAVAERILKDGAGHER